MTKHIVDTFRNDRGIISMSVFFGYIQINDKQFPHKLVFGCGMAHLHYSLEKLVKILKFQKEFFKIEMNHNEVYTDTWEDKKSEWLDYVENDVLCTIFSDAGYCKPMVKITGFSMKIFLLLPGLGRKFFNSLRTEEKEPIYTYNYKYMKWFVRQSIKGGRVCGFNQYYQSKVCDDVLKIISELNVKRIDFGIIEAYS